MYKLFKCLPLLVFCTTVVWAQNYERIRQNMPEVYFKFTINDRAELKELTKVISIDDVVGNEVYAYASQKEYQAFQKRRYSCEILPHPGTLYQPKMTSSTRAARNWDSYPTYETYRDMMYQFARDYPDICVVKSIGTTVKGRELLIAKISDNVNQAEDEPEFLYTSTMHGDETTGYILMLRLIDYLLSNYGHDSRVTNLVNNVEIWINPLANPDGTYRQGNNTVFGATRSNGNNVDLNRNYPDPEDGQHPDGKSWQPETVAWMNFAAAHHFVMSANHHGGAEVLNYPWDTWRQRHADDAWFQRVCHTYADLAQANSPSGYMESHNDGITNGYDWYEVSGGRQDYMNYFHSCREVTFELSNTKLLPENKLPAHWDYNRDAFLTFMEECLYGIRGIVTNNAGEPLDATITVLNHDKDGSAVHTDPAVGDYHRLIMPGTYDLKVTAYGYLPKTIQNVTVGSGAATVVNVTLQPAKTLTISGTVRDAQSGAAIADATITVLDTPLPAATSNANGQYQISNILEGSYTFKVIKTGYATVTQEVELTAGQTIDFNMYVSTAESFENGIPAGWQSGGNSNWTVDNSQAHDGICAVRSGNLSDNQSSSLQVNWQVTQAGEVSFYCKVSSEKNYDYLKFYIDGQLKGQWAGNVDWSKQSYPVSVGNHTFKWVYAKDGSTSSGADCAWLDEVELPPSANTK